MATLNVVGSVAAGAAGVVIVSVVVTGASDVSVALMTTGPLAGGNVVRMTSTLLPTGYRESSLLVTVSVPLTVTASTWAA